MNVNQLKLQVLVNRKLLAGLYSSLSFYKDTKRSADESGNEELEYLCHNTVKKLRKEIKGLVALQVACKQDIQDQLVMDKLIRNLQKQTPHAYAGV